MMNHTQEEGITLPGRKPDLTDRAFRIGLYLKGIDGLFESIGGLLLLVIKPDQVDRLARWLTQGELSQDPHDFIANHILKTAYGLSGSAILFGAIYLLSHGVVKIVLVIEVLRSHLWAYAGLIGVTVLFVGYQVYRLLFDTFSVSLFLLTVFDLLVIYLTQKEYRRHLAYKHTHDNKR